MATRLLTGITTTAIPHLGNYVGCIRPALQFAEKTQGDAFFFLADLHALIKCHDSETIHRSSLAVAATWLACGLDPEKMIFYRQSDIVEITELNWIFNCICAKGLMNRAHAYKAAVEGNEATQNSDPDHGISMGLFCYPILMAADILMFNATHIPVGHDQIQHLEMARDIASRFNHRYRELFVLPEAVVNSDVALLNGTDGRKMSKSYGNTIALFETEKKLRKQIMKIVTNSQVPGEAKDPDVSSVFAMHRAFANNEEIAELRARYEAGIGWGEAKQMLFERIDAELAEARERYYALLARPKEIEAILQCGAEKARRESVPFLEQVRAAVGITRLN